MQDWCKYGLNLKPSCKRTASDSFYPEFIIHFYLFTIYLFTYIFLRLFNFFFHLTLSCLNTEAKQVHLLPRKYLACHYFIITDIERDKLDFVNVLNNSIIFLRLFPLILKYFFLSHSVLSDLHSLMR